jgi:hypothetical protein
MDRMLDHLGGAPATGRGVFGGGRAEPRRDNRRIGDQSRGPARICDRRILQLMAPLGLMARRWGSRTA